MNASDGPDRFTARRRTIHLNQSYTAVIVALLVALAISVGLIILSSSPRGSDQAASGAEDKPSPVLREEKREDDLVINPLADPPGSSNWWYARSGEATSLPKSDNPLVLDSIRVPVFLSREQLWKPVPFADSPSDKNSRSGFITNNE
jgi:hypothetical protein